ncbi:hypothetical protein CFP56_007053 [Quercus suber]|uniref:Uncharacterized protein n=1 Tax=Quercus suber TaxID=58331 RepID=A0AAW0L6B6_QUESU|nr:hypothetical protein CFP56_54314 [Quercus suber]
MSGKPNKKIAFGYAGVVITSSSEGSSSKKMLNKQITSSEGCSSKRVLNKVTELNSSSRMIFKDKHTSCSSHFAKQLKTEKFVDNSSGKLGYKDEVKCTSGLKFNDKLLGNTTEFETQVKFKKTVYPNKSASKFNNKEINYY